MKIIKNYVINYEVIEYKRELNRYILEENKQTKKKDIFFYKCLEQIEYQKSVIYDRVI